MVATSGATLTLQETIAAMREQLFPLATLITPNLAEAEVILGKPVQAVSEMEQAAKQLAKQYHTAVLIKGGHLTADAVDVLYDGTQSYQFKGKRIQTKNTHGKVFGRQKNTCQVVCKLVCSLDMETARFAITLERKA